MITGHGLYQLKLKHAYSMIQPHHPKGILTHAYVMHVEETSFKYSRERTQKPICGTNGEG